MNGVKPMTSNIQRYSLTTGQSVAVGQASARRIMIRVTEDTRVALDQGETGSSYFTIEGGSTIILDPPNVIGNYFLWFLLDSAATGTLEVWLQGVMS